MKTIININLLISQLRKTSYELGYVNGRIEAVRDYCEENEYPTIDYVRAVLGIQKEENPDTGKQGETTDDSAEALGYTE